jgi:hypothetical protein
VSSELLTRMQAAVAAGERQVAAAQELLKLLQIELETLNESVARQAAAVQHLQEGIAAGRGALARAVRLGINPTAAVATHEHEAAPIVAELDHAVATAQQQETDEALAVSPDAVAIEHAAAPVLETAAPAEPTAISTVEAEHPAPAVESGEQPNANR